MKKVACDDYERVLAVFKRGTVIPHGASIRICLYSTILVVLDPGISSKYQVNLSRMETSLIGPVTI